MKKIILCLLILIFTICGVISGCGDEKSAEKPDGGNSQDEPLHGDALVSDFQQTMQSLRESVDRANAMLADRQDNSDYTGKYLAGSNSGEEQNDQQSEAYYDDENEADGSSDNISTNDQTEISSTPSSYNELENKKMH